MSHYCAFTMVYLEFASRCTMYNGPNNITCYNTIWLEEGCLMQGFNWPGRLSSVEIAYLGSLNLR